MSMLKPQSWEDEHLMATRPGKRSQKTNWKPSGQHLHNYGQIHHFEWERGQLLCIDSYDFAESESPVERWIRQSHLEGFNLPFGGTGDIVSTGGI